MQNKPNFKNTQMNANKVLTKDYENVHLHRRPKTNPIQTQYKPNSKPISPKTNPIQNQFVTALFFDGEGGQL